MLYISNRRFCSSKDSLDVEIDVYRRLDEPSIILNSSPRTTNSRMLDNLLVAR